jgi:carboxypeptidase T
MRRMLTGTKHWHFIMFLALLAGMIGIPQPGSARVAGTEQAFEAAPQAAALTTAPALPTLMQYDQPPPPDAPPAYWVVRAYFSDREQVNQVVSWLSPWEVNHAEGYLVAEVTIEQIALLELAGFTVEIDYEATSKLNLPHVPLPGQIDGIPGYPCYRTVEETYATAEQIVADHPDLASWILIGYSWEKLNMMGGYDVMVLRLTNSAITVPKPKVFMMASMHAREYTPAELATRFAEMLVDNYGVDADITWLLDYHEVHLLLQANPDGRKRAEAGQSWRKNANNFYCSNSNNRGADLNRNYPFQWGCCNGSSPYQCDSTYRGPFANSEPETSAVTAYVASIFPDQREDDLNAPAPVDATGVFLDLHSYSELVLWPWGFVNNPAPNGTALRTLGRKFAFFNNYTPQQAIFLYPTDGTTDDFAYGDLGLAAYTFELGTTFFQACNVFENTILPTNLPALLYAAKVARTPYMTPAGPDTLNLALSEPIVFAGDPVALTATLNDTRFNNSQGTEPTQNIAAGEVYIDVPPWLEDENPVAIPMEPVDGNFNTPVEQARAILDISDLSGGQHILYVRGQDAAGNWGAFSAIFLEVIPHTLTHNKQASQAEAAPGDIVSYILDQQVSAEGEFTATHTLTDTLPVGLVVLTETLMLNGAPAPELYDAGAHTIAYADGGVYTDLHTVNITYDAQVDPFISPSITLVNTLTSTAVVDGEPVDPPGPASVSLAVILPELTHDKQADLAEALPGQLVTYTLQQQLTGLSIDEVTQTLTDTLPAQLLVLTDTIQVNGTPAPELYDPDTHTIVYSQTGMFTPPNEIVITYQAQVDTSLAEPMVVANTLTSAAEADGDPVPAPEPVSASLQILIPPVLVHAKQASQEEAAPGEVIAYTLHQQLSMPGLFNATQTLTDTLPAGLTILTETLTLDGAPAPELYDAGTHTIAYSLTGDHADLSEFTIAYQALLDPDLEEGTLLVNTLASTASIAGEPVPAPDDTTASVPAGSISSANTPTTTTALSCRWPLTGPSGSPCGRATTGACCSIH